MLVKKAYKFRLYPNKQQAELINKTIGCSRFVANFILAQQKKEESYWSITNELVQQGIFSENNFKSKLFNKAQSVKDVAKLKKHYTWLKEVDSIALQSSVESLADAYSRYYKKQNAKPKFKSKKNPVQSYTTKTVNGNIEVLDNHIKLPKLGIVRFAKSKEVTGTIKRVTIRSSPSERYYISILAETEVLELAKTNSTVGIDVGLSKFATLSNGVQYDNPKFFRTLEKKLADAQRILSRRKCGSSNWNKQRIKVARMYERVTNCRTDYLQKISTEIIKNHDVIGLEDLKVVNMTKNRNLAKAITEVSWYQFRTMLEYKAKWYGKQVILIDPKYTSQRCNHCGHTEKENRVSQAKFVCKSCNHTDNADVNASKNIEELALVS
ncbi:TPA: transposase [Bacillus mycoides]|nr:transposase [Bacillus mycoides]